MPETKKIDNNEVMKEQFQNLTRSLRQQGADLAETPAVFKWEYPDDPYVMYQLVIVELTEETKAFIEEDANTVH